MIGGHPQQHQWFEDGWREEEQMGESAWHWRRGAILSAIFFLACWLYMDSTMTPNTSWGHNPFSGPLVVLHTAVQPLDYIIGGLM